MLETVHFPFVSLNQTHFMYTVLDLAFNRNVFLSGKMGKILASPHLIFQECSLD